MSDSSNLSAPPPDSLEPTTSSSSSNDTPSSGRRSSRPPSWTQLSNMNQHSGRLDKLRNDVDSSNWPPEAKLVLQVAIEVHEKQQSRRRSLRTNGASSQGQDGKFTAESFDFEEVERRIERDEEFYKFLEAVRKRTSALLKGAARERAKSVGSEGYKYKFYSQLEEGRKTAPPERRNNTARAKDLIYKKASRPSIYRLFNK
ncbi:hypothetical protein B0T20DRAFT_466538 [Sordaria brevicollis]|uniref:Uncharacterized protein n=1 Tax=Sordaria brevicollis TaxID=83679 RepID=A0AAE0PKJ0_SORBR|nr:hypothetical protein B0T20DRAFT_466538 [Sordaria brevicollis]